MQTSNSSTSNSEPAKKPFVFNDWVGIAKTGLGALLVFGFVEFGARLLLGPDDDWKFWQMSVGERIDQLELKNDIDVLFLGDSTVEMNLVPSALEKHTGLTSFNLGTAGNLLGSFEGTMLDEVVPNLTNQPKAFIIGFTPRSYRKTNLDVNNEPINQSLMARSSRGELIYGDLFAIARLRHLIRGQLPENQTLPHVKEHGWRTWQQVQDQKRPIAKTKIPKAPWAEKPEKTKNGSVFLEKKLSVINKIGALAGDRPVLFLIPPFRRDYSKLADKLRARAPANVTVWDYSKRTRYPRHEGAHLTEEGAIKWTSDLAKRIKEEGIFDDL